MLQEPGAKHLLPDPEQLYDLWRWRLLHFPYIILAFSYRMNILSESTGSLSATAILEGSSGILISNNNLGVPAEPATPVFKQPRLVPITTYIDLWLFKIPQTRYELRYD